MPVIPFLGTALSFLSKYWMYIAIAIVVFYFVERWNIMENTIAKNKTEISQLHDQNKALSDQAVQIKQNQDNLDTGTKIQSGIKTHQQTTKEKMNNVQVKLVDKPFTDPGLSTRASILRQHQDSTFPSS
jgi:predicted RNase H-like nuclease (RuvC/YqgF family)